MATKKKSDDPKSVTVSNCTFTNEAGAPLTDIECRTLEALANAIEANAQAITAVAQNLRGAPVSMGPLMTL